jgi:hypothetical protein
MARPMGIGPTVSERLVPTLLVTALLACNETRPYPDPLGATGTRCADLGSLVEQVQAATPETRATLLVEGLRTRCTPRTPALDLALNRWQTGADSHLEAWEVLCREDPTVLDRPTAPDRPRPPDGPRQPDRPARLRAAAAACDLLATDLFEAAALPRVSDVEGALLGVSLYRSFRQQPETLPYVARTLGQWLAGLPDGAGRYVDRGIHGEVHEAVGDLQLVVDPKGPAMVPSCATLWTLRDGRIETRVRGEACTPPQPTIAFIDARASAASVLEQLTPMEPQRLLLAGAQAGPPPGARWDDRDRLTLRAVHLGPASDAPTVLVHGFHAELLGSQLPPLPTTADGGETARFVEAVHRAATGGRVQITAAPDTSWVRLIETLQMLDEAAADAPIVPHLITTHPFSPPPAAE